MNCLAPRNFCHTKIFLKDGMMSPQYVKIKFWNQYDAHCALQLRFCLQMIHELTLEKRAACLHRP